MLGCAEGVMNSSSELEIGEPRSISTRVCQIQLRENTHGKGNNPPLPHTGIGELVVVLINHYFLQNILKSKNSFWL